MSSEYGVEKGAAGGITVRHGIDADITDFRSAFTLARLLMLLLLLTFVMRMMLSKYLENHVNVRRHLLLESRQLPADNQYVSVAVVTTTIRLRVDYMQFRARYTTVLYITAYLLGDQ